MSQRKTTSTILTTPHKSSKRPSKRKISSKTTHNYNEDTQSIKNYSEKINKTEGENDTEMNEFTVNPHIFEEYKGNISKRTIDKGNISKTTRLATEQEIINNILNKIDLKAYYEEILTFNVDFLLPRKYKLLFNKFIALDKTIYARNIEKKPCYFRDIQYQLQLDGVYIGFKDLGQISYINPQFYKLLNRPKGLSIEINENLEENQDFLNERSKSLKNYMINILKIYHFNFLKSIGEERDYIMYESQKVWHMNFQLEKMPDIPFKDISEFYPKLEKTRNSKQKKIFIKKNEILESGQGNITMEEKIMNTVYNIFSIYIYNMYKCYIYAYI